MSPLQLDAFVSGGARDKELFGGIENLSEGQLVEVRTLGQLRNAWLGHASRYRADHAASE